MGKVKWIDMTPGLTTKGKKNINVGQVMIFEEEGSRVYIKIMRKYKGKVWGKQIDMYLPSEVDIIDR